MDYLDPRKRLRHTIILYVGYCLIGIAIIIATVVLLYQAYGFGIDRKGTVIQNGLVFISSVPRPADVYINGTLEKSRTNTRLALPEASYRLSLQRQGYLSWDRTITVEGGQVSHYDYPLLVPKNLATTKILAYTKSPSLVSQSPDKRWILVGVPDNLGTFDLFDLKNPGISPVSLALPPSVITAAEGEQTLAVVDWADDNQHILIQHGFNGKSEYVLMDRQTPIQSENLTTKLKTATAELKLVDRKYDRYYAYDAATQTLSQATLKSPELQLVQQGVLSYRSYGTDVILYASKVGASAGQARIQLKVGNRLYTIRSVSDNSTYVLDITKYNDTFYAVVGASSESKVYIYRDPAAQIGSNLFRSPAPTQVLHVADPTYVGFSSNAQYIVAENGNQFGVYDIENKHGFNFTAKQPIDAPQMHASWMDGNRLSYVSSGKHIIFDYDYVNMRTLSSSVADTKPMYAPDYKYTYTMQPGANGQYILSQTALLIPSEL